MKRILSAFVVCIMLVSSFTIGVSATFEKATNPEHIWNFEADTVDTTTYGDARVVANPDSGSTNTKVLSLTANAGTGIANYNTVEAITGYNFSFKTGTYFEFRTKRTSDGNLPLTVMLGDGNNNPLMRCAFTVTLDETKVQKDKWYTVSLYTKDGVYAKDFNGLVTILDEESNTAKTETVTLNGNNRASINDPGSARNHINFSISRPSEGVSVPTTYIIDDIAFYNQKEYQKQGLYFSQNFEDATYTVLDDTTDNTAIVATGEEAHGSALRYGVTASLSKDNITGESNWAPDVPDFKLSDNKHSMVLSFDVKKEKASLPLSVYVCNDGSSNCFSMLIPAQQLRENVWYTYVGVVGEGANNIIWYRKAPGDTSYVLCPWTSDTGEFEKVTGNVDVTRPVYGSAIPPGVRTKSIGFCLHALSRYDAFKDSAADSKGSYLIDNVKLAELNNLQCEIIKTAGDGVNLKFDVYENRPVATATRVMLGCYDAQNKLIDVKIVPVEDSKVDISLTAAEVSAMTTARLFVWDVDNVPLLAAAWDVTEEIKSAE